MTPLSRPDVWVTTEDGVWLAVDVDEPAPRTPGATATGLSEATVAASSFGSRVPRGVRRLVRDMILSTDPEVMATFAPTLLTHDTTEQIDTLADLPALVIVGDWDVLTPAPPPQQAGPRHTVVDLRPGRGRRAPTLGGR